MQEMNGVWFWWGIDSHRTDPGPYIRVYRAMRDYFTKDKGLDNLIWVYSPTSTYGNETVTNYVFRAVDWAYPGDDYVDIIAGTNYADDMSISDYGTYVKMGKPLGIAEYGPNSEGPYLRMGPGIYRASSNGSRTITPGLPSGSAGTVIHGQVGPWCPTSTPIFFLRIPS